MVVVNLVINIEKEICENTNRYSKHMSFLTFAT